MLKCHFSYTYILLQNEFLGSSFALTNLIIILPLICFTVNIVWLRNSWNKTRLVYALICEAFMECLLYADLCTFLVPATSDKWSSSLCFDSYSPRKWHLLSDKKYFHCTWTKHASYCVHSFIKHIFEQLVWIGII